MAETKNALLPWLRLVRAGTLFSPGCDVVAGICIAGAGATLDGGEISLASIAGWRAIAASVAVYAAGMVWNDVADRREDARQRPERPIPRGDVSLAGAVALGLLLLIGGIALSPPIIRPVHTLLAVLVLVYDFAAKRVRPVGAIVMGSLRALNLAAVGFALGEWVFRTPYSLAVVPRAALVTAAICYGIYIFAVTVLGILEDAASPRRGQVLLVQSLPPLAALCGITVVQGGVWPAPILALAPLALFVRRMLRVTTWDQRAIRGSMLWLLLGTMLYTALLALAAGSWPAAVGIALCIAPARWIARRISLT
jgi:4-hydroxybenzoate polyprenyltransferase